MVEFEFEDTKPKPEESEFRKAKKEEYENVSRENFKSEQKNQENQNPNPKPSSSDNDLIGVAAAIYESWNALPFDLIKVNDSQKVFLDKHSKKFEDKYLKNLNLLPEYEFALSSFIVYTPLIVDGIVKKQKRTKKDDKDGKA